MDDTVLLSTTREGLMKKFQIVQKYCVDYNMSINQKKTQFMVINNQEDDKSPIISRGITVKYCKQYLYLGSCITDDGVYKSAIEADISIRNKNVLKFFTFINQNPDLPFMMKKRVTEACVFSSILYGRETWLCDDFGRMNSIYMSVV